MLSSILLAAAVGIGVGLIARVIMTVAAKNKNKKQ